MDALVEQAWQAPVFRKSNLLYVYCVDLEHVSELSIPSLPFLKLKCLFGHVSFPRTLSERRMVVFPQCNRVLDKLKDATSPCVIKIISSVIFQVMILYCCSRLAIIDCDLNAARYLRRFTKLNTNNFFLQIHPDEIDDDGEVMLIWDFAITDLSLTASHCSVKAKIPSSVSPIDSFMPPLDLSRVTCNCVNSSLNGKVLVLSRTESRTVSEINIQKLSLSDVDEENACEEEEDDKEEEEEEDDGDFADASGSSSKELFAPESTECPPTEPLYTETFILKGSSFHEHFQRTLKSCKDKMINKETISIRLGKEPVNRRDENAILVHACPGDTWEPIGYIPGVKVLKVTKAIDNNEITSMSLLSVKYQYVFSISSFKYFAVVTISKKGRWAKNNDNYKYDETF